MYHQPLLRYNNEQTFLALCSETSSVVSALVTCRPHFYVSLKRLFLLCTPCFPKCSKYSLFDSRSARCSSVDFPWTRSQENCIYFFELTRWVYILHTINTILMCPLHADDDACLWNLDDERQNATKNQECCWIGLK